MKRFVATGCLLLGSAWARPTMNVTSACNFIDSLKAIPITDVKNTFQLLDTYTIDNSSSPAKVTSTHRLSTLPHILWGMAQLSENVDNLPRKPIDMPTIEGFMILAKKAYDAGQLSSVKYRYLQLLNSIGDNSGLRSARSGAVQGEIEKEFPGVITGTAGTFTDSKTYNDFMAASGFKKAQLLATDWTLFNTWTSQLPLFVSSKWSDLAQDLGAELAFLARGTKGSLPLGEQVCTWLIHERVLAQFVTLMGTKGAPKLKEDGHLDANLWVNTTPRGEAVYPVEDRPNAKGQFLDQDWVVNRLNGHVDLSKEFTDSTELLGFMDLSSSWMSNRSESLWAVDSTGKTGVALPLDILRLGFGVLGVSLKNFHENHLKVFPGGRIQIKVNTNENLVELAWFSLRMSKGLGSLQTPNAVERAALTANQMQEFIGAGGVRESLYQLFTGTIIEALARRRASKYEIEVLYQFLTQAGDALDNDYLRNLPRKPAPPQD